MHRRQSTSDAAPAAAGVIDQKEYQVTCGFKQCKLKFALRVENLPPRLACNQMDRHQ